MTTPAHNSVDTYVVYFVDDNYDGELGHLHVAANPDPTNDQALFFGIQYPGGELGHGFGMTRDDALDMITNILNVYHGGATP